jgi:hypothetical protein
MVDWGSVGRTVFDKAAPELSRLYTAKQEGKLGETILAKAFPEMYSLSKRYRSFRDKKKAGATDTSEIGEQLEALSSVTMQQNQAINQSSSLVGQQNEILVGILQELRDIKSSNKSGLGVEDLLDLADLGGKKSGTTGKPKPKEGYRYNEKTGRYHDAKTNRMVTEAEATGKASPKGPAEKVGGPKVGETASKGGGAGKALGYVGIALAIYDAYKEIDALDINDPEYKKKVTAIISKAVAQFGLATVGAVFAGIIGSAIFPGIGTIVGIIVGVAGGVAAQAVFGDSVDELVDYIVDKMFEKKGAKKVGSGVVGGPVGAAVGSAVEALTSDKDEVTPASGVYGTVEYEAAEIDFDADEMEIVAGEVILNGAEELGDVIKEGTTTLGQAPSREGGRPPAENEIAKDLNLESITTKSGRSAKVAGAYKDKFQGFVNELEDAGYSIKDIGGYAYRPNVNNPSVLSYHSFGAAIDINPMTNPNNTRRTDMPDATAGIAAKYGLGWGINFGQTPDPMHFSIARGEGGSVPISRTGQKIESYGSGGKLNKDGKVVVGDAKASRSNAEVIKQPNGINFLAKKPSVMDLAKGSKVMSIEQAAGELFSPQGLFNAATGIVSSLPVGQQVVAGARTLGAVGTNLAQGNVKGALKQGIIEASAAIPDPTGLASAAVEYGANQLIDDDKPSGQAPKNNKQPQGGKKKTSAAGTSSSKLLAMNVSAQ